MSLMHDKTREEREPTNPMTPKVKICGITRQEDALAAVAAGADFLGFIFVESSARRVDPAQVIAIMKAVRQTEKGRDVSMVGVFRNDDPRRIRSIVRQTNLDLVQLHGDETDDISTQIPVPVIQAFRVASLPPDCSRHPSATWVLFDTYVAHLEGGTGATFDWRLLAGHPPQRQFFLSGGLNPDNVAEAIRIVRPHAIDLSSGVEDAPGVKNHEKIQRLFMEIGAL